MPRTTTCTYHCSACGLHFHSLEGFDAHRAGDFTSIDPELERRCIHPLDMAGRLVPLIVGGECRLYDDGSGAAFERDVTIWTTSRQTGQRPWEKPREGVAAFTSTAEGAREANRERPLAPGWSSARRGRCS